MISLLYVDDEPDLLDLCKVFLEREGDFSVTTITSATEGLQILSPGTFDAIISDYQMPDIDGIEFLKRVRLSHGDLPFILFTGKGREEVVIEAINQGVDFYIQKGGDPKAQFAELGHKVKKAVERRHTIDALRDSERRLSDIINFLPDATFAINQQGTVIAWNKALEDMSGYTAGSMIGKGNYEYSLAFYPVRRPILIDLIHEPPEKIQIRDYTLIKNERGVLVAETSQMNPRDKSGVFLVKASLLYDKNGTITGAIESIKDITESKKIEGDLRKREAELNSIFRAAPAGIGVVDNRVFREVNDYLCEMVGYTREELIGKNARIIYPTEEDYAYVGRENYGQIIHKGTGSIETRFLHKDGTIIEVLISSAPLVSGDLEGGVTFIAIDITSRKMMENAIRAENEKNRGLMDHANDAIFIADADTGMLIDANKKAQEMIGKTLMEIQEMHQTDLYPREDRHRYQKLFMQHVREGTSLQIETILGQKGRHIPVIVSATILNLGGKLLLMGIFHDISEIQKAQDALQVANKKLNLLAEITRHDIHNKLTVLSGYLELMKDCPAEPNYSMYMRKLSETATTIRQNIEFTKLYQNLGIVAPVWQKVHDVFFRACSHIDIKKIRVQSDIEGLEIFADPLLERVFYNIVENAVMHGDRVSVIRISCHESFGGLTLVVEDNGGGIPVESKDKIFTKGYGRNTGLGLFLVQEILSITNISIRETGEYQKGARLELYVPPGMYRFLSTARRDRCHIRLNDVVKIGDRP